MSNKQFFAQIAVFALLGVNVAAYYFFWPSHGGWASRGSIILPREKSTPTDSGEKPVAEIPAPQTFQPLAVSSRPPGFPEIAEPVPSQPSKDDVDPVNQLLKEIQKQPAGKPAVVVSSPLSAPPDAFPAIQRKAEDKLPFAPAPANDLKNGPINSVVQPPPEIPTRPAERVTLPIEPPEKKNTNPGSPFVLPPLSGEPLGGGRQVRDEGRDNDHRGANPLPLVPRPLSEGAIQKLQQGPWRVHMEAAGTRTRLIAQVWYKASARPVAAFNILCDRVEVNPSQTGVQAVGKVVFAGAGLRGSCERLTLPYSEMQMVFEESVQLADVSAAPPASGAEGKQAAPNPGYLLRGERMTWEPPSPPRAADANTEVRPASFNPLAPLAIPSESR